MEKNSVLQFMTFLFKILWIAGTICFACFMLYYIVDWHWSSVSQSIWILVRIIITTVLCFYIHAFLDKKSN